jgi:hypothetical protein
MKTDIGSGVKEREWDRSNREDTPMSIPARCRGTIIECNVIFNEHPEHLKISGHET